MSRTLILSLAVLVLLTAGVVALVAPRPAAAAEADKKPAATFEIYKDKAGEYRWRLRMTNTKVIATSGEGYGSKQACEEGIESVKKHAADAAVEEKTADGDSR